MRKQIRLHLTDHRLCAILVGLLCGTLYVRTLAPTAMWYDMAEMAAAAYFLGIAHHTGYPLYLLLGKLFTFIPLGDVGYRANLMSAVFAAITVAIVFFIVWDLTQRRGAAGIAALTLGASSTLWSNATMAESYALNAFLTAALTYLALTWQRSGRRAPLWGAFYLLGLGMGNHHLIQFFGVALLSYWLGVSRHRGLRLHWRDPLAFGLLFLAGFAINLYLPIRASQKPAMMWADASDWPTFWRMISAGQSRESIAHLFTMSPAILLRRLQEMLVFPPYEFTVIGLALAVWGAARLWRGNRALLLYSLVGSGLTLLLVVSYEIHNIFQYLLPLYVMAAIWLGVGAAAFLELPLRWQKASTDAKGHQSLARVAPRLLNLLLLALPAYLVVRDLPVLDRSQDDSSYLYANYLSGRVEKGAHIVADFWAWAPLAYHQAISGWRTDLRIYGSLSSASISWSEFIPSLRSDGDRVYVAAGGPLPPGLSMNALLHPVGINVVETVTGFGVPEPRHKDLWLPRGSVYRVVSRPPSLAVDAVPASRRIEETRFGEHLSLVGFGGPEEPQRIGDTPRLTYYWVVSEQTDVDYYVRVRLEDESGSPLLLRGLPVWDHSHLVGGLSPTSAWTPGVIMGERYGTLMPWRIRPGRYAIKAWVYESEEAKSPVSPGLPGDQAEGIVLGHLEVLPRRGPFDVRLQQTPRE